MGLSLFYKSITSPPIKAASKTKPARNTSLEDIPTPQDSSYLSGGYRELSKNKTLAGREVSRQFRGEERDFQPNRMKMVSRLRDKEKFMIWRHVISDLSRYVLTEFNKLNPARIMPADPYDVSNSAVRFRR